MREQCSRIEHPARLECKSTALVVCHTAAVTRLDEIVDAGRRQLAEVGPADLSLRAVAREMGVVSSAVYRYVTSRDELLTLLIVGASDDLGARTEAAVAASRRRAPVARWIDAARTVRSWAHEHPHEYALLYGTPVPGYEAPAEQTSPAGIRVSLALLSIVRDADVGAVDGPPIPRALAKDLDVLKRTIDLDVPDAVLVRAIAAWTQLFGLVTFELFNQTRGMVTDDEALFVAAVTAMADQMGLGG
jgi:AcrR family transcriptional regulator